MLPQCVIDAAREVGKFYLAKNANDYAKTREELLDLGITKLEIQGDTLQITAVRVGKLIGKRGQNVQLLTEHVEKSLGLKVRVIEDTDCLCEYLIPKDGLEEYDG